MALEALLISRHEQTVRLLHSVLQGVQVSSRVCEEPKDAVDLLERQHFGAVIVDFDLPGGTELLKSTRLAVAHKKSVIFAVISRFSSTGSAFELGANFVLYKPLSEEQVGRAVRAARAFMKPERRRLIRHRLEALAYLTVRVTVKREAEPSVQEQTPVADRVNQHSKNAMEKVS